MPELRCARCGESNLRGGRLINPFRICAPCWEVYKDEERPPIETFVKVAAPQPEATEDEAPKPKKKTKKKARASNE